MINKTTLFKNLKMPYFIWFQAFKNNLKIAA